MIWLASFPRSGNTFFRNVLFEVYSLESSTYHIDPTRKLDKNFDKYTVIKTHLLPWQLPPRLKDRPAVYLIRDGRDSLVSIAHHRKDIVEKGTNFEINLLQAILSYGGSNFGGWSENVRQWTSKADIVIRFEDLIQDPIREIEKLRAIMDLPQPDLSKLPDFKSLKFGDPKYGGGKLRTASTSRAEKHFRRGKVGSWKDEMPVSYNYFLNKIHGPTLEKWNFKSPESSNPKKQKKILIEASKLFSSKNDGIKRYLSSLVTQLRILNPYFPHLEIWLFDQKSIYPLLSKPKINAPKENVNNETDFQDLREKDAIKKDRNMMGYEKRLLLFKAFLRERLSPELFKRGEVLYGKIPIRSSLARLKQLATKWNDNLVRIKFKKSEFEIIQEIKNADLLHVPLPQHLVDIKEFPKRIVVTAHDLSHKKFSQFHIPNNIKRSEKGIELIKELNADVIAVSNFTKRDFEESCHIASDKIKVCYEAADTKRFKINTEQKSFNRVRKQYGIPNGPYFLTVSTIEPRKNTRNTILAFLEFVKKTNFEGSLVISGKKGWKVEEMFEGLELKHHNIVFTGFVKESDLPVVYSNALALCYLSFYEGFGLPMLEAMACKLPVLYGDNSSMPEVAGEGGIGVDVSDISDIVSGMEKLWSDSDLRQELSELAFIQSRKFSWLRAAYETLCIYDNLTENDR